MNSILCTICMRSGSRGVKNKNIKLINGRPLMYYTIKQAIKSRIFDHIVVSTDSKKILKLQIFFDFIFFFKKFIIGLNLKLYPT